MENWRNNHRRNGSPESRGSVAMDSYFFWSINVWPDKVTFQRLWP